MSRLLVVFLALVVCLTACTKEKVVYVEVPVEIPVEPSPTITPVQIPPKPDPPVLSQWERERLASMEKDGKLLMEFYRLTGGDSWKKKDNWGSTPIDLRVWHGVSYRRHSQRGWEMYGLYLSMNGLKGKLPDFIGEFEGLRFLDLRGNHLEGPIPQQFSRMKNFEDINLVDNKLTGSIPDLNQSRPRHLALSNNQLSGPIPAWLSQADNLGRIWLAHNQFTGSFKTESIHRFASNVTLNDNQLSGELPIDLLEKRPDLAVLRLHNNQFTGPIPAEWVRAVTERKPSVCPHTGAFSCLKELTLSGNNFTGCIPSGLFAIRKHDLDQIDLPPCP